MAFLEAVFYSSVPHASNLDSGKEPDSISIKIRQEWNDIYRTMSLLDINIAYARFMCIETNEIEGVFSLGGESMIRLVSGGFFISAIQHVDPNSTVKDKHKIIQILKDVQAALYKTIRSARMGRK